MEAQAALGRAARRVVLHPVSREDPDGAVVELDREPGHDLALRGTKDRPELVIEVEVVGGVVELLEGGGVGAAARGGYGGGGRGLQGGKGGHRDRGSGRELVAATIAAPGNRAGGRT
jgi:hypothetical protein